MKIHTETAAMLIVFVLPTLAKKLVAVWYAIKKLRIQRHIQIVITRSFLTSQKATFALQITLINHLAN
ncbi:hypothetical protein BKI52_01190 [marine bacterium AO1-C]|nr:hypothetical protein BKI52_01190 [marine bacterium AO1-C]